MAVDLERKERMNKVYQYLKFQRLINTQKDLAEQMKSTQPNISSALSGDEKVLTDNFFLRLNASYDNIFNKEWLLEGEGEMLRVPNYMSQDGKGGTHQQGSAGHNLTQTNNSEKILSEFIEGLKSSNDLTKQAMAQTERAMSQTDKALDEMSEQRKMMQQLIGMLNNSQKSEK